MKHQLQYLIALGAYENATLADHKAGMTSDMIWLYENEKLWNEAQQPVSFQEAVQREMAELERVVVEFAIDGTVFPQENTDFSIVFQHIIYNACEELELEISFDGFSYEEARQITADKRQFIEKLRTNQLSFSHLAFNEEQRICILTFEQVEKLAILSVQFDVYRYFDVEWGF